MFITGVITTGNILDYDGSNWLGVPPDPLPGDPQVYTIPVIVSDGTVTSQENLMVELYDVNEQHTLVINPTTSTVPASTTGAGVLVNEDLKNITCFVGFHHNLFLNFQNNNKITTCYRYAKLSENSIITILCALRLH